MADQDLKKDFEALRKDLDALRTDIERLADSGAAEASNVTQEAREHLEEEAQKLIARLRDAAGEIKVGGVKITEGIEGQLKENPLTALLASFGLGLVAGWLVSRR